MILYVVISYFLKHSPTAEFSLRFSKSSDIHLGLQFTPQTFRALSVTLTLEVVLNQEQCMFCVVVMLEDKVIYFVFTYHSFFMNPSTVTRFPVQDTLKHPHSTPITAFQCVCS